MNLWHLIQNSLGLEAETLTLWHMTWRAIIVYITLLVLLRMVADRRFGGQHSPIDLILSIVLGATLSRAINGNAPFFGTLGVGFVLIALHWLLSALTFRFTKLEKMLKGQALTLIQDGEIHQRRLQAGHISHSDLASSLRLKGKSVDFSQVAHAALETSGKISLITQPTPCQVLEVSVESGVQTVRIQLEK